MQADRSRGAAASRPGRPAPLEPRAASALWRRRRGCGHLGDRFAGLAEKADGALHRDADARLHDDLQQRAFLEALHFHDRLVGLDGEQDVALGDLVAFLLEPFDDGAFFGHLTELGHDDRGSHGVPYRMALAAARMSFDVRQERRFENVRLRRDAVLGADAFDGRVEVIERHRPGSSRRSRPCSCRCESPGWRRRSGRSSAPSARTVSMSSGTRLRRSMTSALTPFSAFSLSAALRQSCTSRAPGDQRDVAALALDVGHAERNEVFAFRHRAFHAVERLRLDEHDRVVVANGRLEHALRVVRRRGINHVQAGDVAEHGFQRLRMLAAVALAGARRGADDQRHFGLRAAHVMPFRGLVADLVGRHQREVEVHQLDHRPQPDHRRAAAGAADAGFADRRVEHAVAPERFEQALGDLEGAAVIGHVFAVEDHALVARHFLDQRFLERVLVGELAVDALDLGQRADELHLRELGRHGLALRVGVHELDHVLRRRDRRPPRRAWRRGRCGRPLASPPPRCPSRRAPWRRAVPS